jgi:hypothetical protein
MNSIACSIAYGSHDIDYTLLFANRKTLEIAVHPDRSVIVKAPMNSMLTDIEKKVKKRANWILKQIRYFDQFDPRTPERRYVGGESHLYLGKNYRLKIECGLRDHVTLKNGFFEIETTRISEKYIQSLLDAWYKEKCSQILHGLFDECWCTYDKGHLSKPRLKVQKMEKRWGSLSEMGTLTLNSSLIRTPKECIEYVIIHELCHLVHHNHSLEFYKLLDRSMPDWVKRKYKLEMALS